MRRSSPPPKRESWGDVYKRQVLAYLQGLTADEEADNAYCEQLYQDYLNDPDPDKHQTISLEELCKREDVEL